MSVTLAVVDSGPGCNNRCVVCPRPSPADASAAFVALPLAPDAKLPGAAGEPLWLHGGEPSLHPGFEALLARAKAEGRTVHVETNARAFSVGDRALRAARGGLSVALVTLYGAREASHDFLTRTPGSFRQTIAGASRLRAAGVKLIVRLVVTRSSMRELTAMATLALGLGPLEVRFSWARMDVPPGGPLPFVRGETYVKGKPNDDLRVHPIPIGDEANYDRSREWPVARYGLAIEFLASAIATVQRVKRPVSLDGVPACLAPAGVRVARTGAACATPFTAPDRPDLYAPVCEGCALRERCPGTPSGYLARFGHDELVPAAAASTALEPAAAPVGT